MDGSQVRIRADLKSDQLGSRRLILLRNVDEALISIQRQVPQLDAQLTVSAKSPENGLSRVRSFKDGQLFERRQREDFAVLIDVPRVHYVQIFEALAVFKRHHAYVSQIPRVEFQLLQRLMAISTDEGGQSVAVDNLLTTP